MVWNWHKSILLKTRIQHLAQRLRESFKTEERVFMVLVKKKGFCYKREKGEGIKVLLRDKEEKKKYIQKI